MERQHGLLVVPQPTWLLIEVSCPTTPRESSKTAVAPHFPDTCSAQNPQLRAELVSLCPASPIPSQAGLLRAWLCCGAARRMKGNFSQGNSYPAEAQKLLSVQLLLAEGCRELMVGTLRSVLLVGHAGPDWRWTGAILVLGASACGAHAEPCAQCCCHRGQKEPLCTALHCSALGAHTLSAKGISAFQGVDGAKGPSRVRVPTGMARS